MQLAPRRRRRRGARPPGTPTSSVAASAGSRLRRASPGRPYLNAIVSPCSVMRRRPGGCARRLGQDRRVGRPAAAAGRAAAAVEDRQLDVALARATAASSDCARVDRPLRGQVAAVLGRVGVADHHRRRRRRGAPAAPASRGVVEQLGEDRRRAREVVDRLEQRHDAEVAACRLGQRDARPRTSSAPLVPETMSGVDRLGAVRACASRTASSVACRPLVGLRAPGRRARARRAGPRAGRRARPRAAASASRPSAMRAPRVRAQASGRSGRGRRSSSAASRVARLVAAAPSSLSSRCQIGRQLAAVGLVALRRPVSSRSPAARASSRAIERQQLRVGADERCPRRRARGRARAPRRGSRAAPGRGRARARVEQLGRGRVRVAVLVAADPGAEAQRRAAGRAAPACQRRASSAPASNRLDSKNQSPCADLVDDARAERAHLVRLPQHRRLLGQRALDRGALGRRRARVVERVEQPAEAQLALQERAARGLGRVRGQHGLEQRRRRPARAARASPMPAARMAANEASSALGARAVLRRARRRRRRMRWYCSARFASTK